MINKRGLFILFFSMIFANAIQANPIYQEIDNTRLEMTLIKDKNSPQYKKVAKRHTFFLILTLKELFVNVFYKLNL